MHRLGLVAWLGVAQPRESALQADQGVGDRQFVNLHPGFSCRLACAGGANLAQGDSDVGILVDDATADNENIDRNLDAILVGTQEISTPTIWSIRRQWRTRILATSPFGQNRQRGSR